MSKLQNPNRRILLVDDNPAIHEDFKRVLLRDDSEVRDLDAEAAALFGGEAPVESVEEQPFELESAYQGKEALEKVEEACAEGKPYAMAFVDMRMPPGWDGLRTIQEIWKVDPSMQIVICTAFSDRSWNEIQRTLTARDQWLVVKKPFDQIEVLQLANAFTKKWDLNKAADLRQNVLEQMVSARTEQLSAALQTNSDFLDHVSHEMLTPMNSIIGFLDLLGEAQLTSEEIEFINEAKNSSEQLLHLINQVLAFKKAGSEEIQPLANSVNLQEWLTEILDDRLRQRAIRKGLELVVDVESKFDSPVQFPTNIVGKVLDILVENAIKFTQSGSVKVSVVSSEVNPGDLLFEVTDTGVGLSPEQLQYITIPFAQVDGSLARSNDGIGIGLPLARRLLKLVGSSIDIHSMSGEGTRATFAITAATRQMAV